MKRIIACLMAGVMLLALVGCGASGSSGSASSAAKKDYTQILHDARSDEDNKYEMIFTKGEDGKFTAQYGYSAEYEADQLSDEVANMMMPLLGLEDDMYDDFAASVSGMSKICDETYPKTTAALISIVQEIRNLNPDAQIILVGYTNPVPLIPCWRSYFNKLNKFEKQIAKTYNLTYVAIPNTETTLDVHPTIKGHQYIANKLVNAIENP